METDGPESGCESDTASEDMPIVRPLSPSNTAPYAAGFELATSDNDQVASDEIDLDVKSSSAEPTLASVRCQVARHSNDAPSTSCSTTAPEALRSHTSQIKVHFSELEEVYNDAGRPGRRDTLTKLRRKIQCSENRAGQEYRQCVLDGADPKAARTLSHSAVRSNGDFLGAVNTVSTNCEHVPAFVAMFQ